MSLGNEPTHAPMKGESVMLLVHTDDRPQWALARISDTRNLTVELDAAHAELFRDVNSLLIVHDSGRKYTKGEGKVDCLTVSGDKAQIRFAGFRWESVDNRDNPRFNVEVKVIVRTINEIDGGLIVDDQVGLTSDLSLGGAKVKLSAPVAKGQLVEFRASLDPAQSIRAMGIVAHTDLDSTEVGITFIDYIGSARYSLHQFLSSLAA